MHKPRRDARQVEGDHIYIAFDTKKEEVITNPLQKFSIKHSSKIHFHEL